MAGEIKEQSEVWVEISYKVALCILASEMGAAAIRINIDVAGGIWAGSGTEGDFNMAWGRRCSVW